jgi:hypothetical protein
MQHDTSVSDIHFIGLLYINPDQEQSVNIKDPTVNPIDVYLGCAALCASSAKAAGHRFSLVTNERALVLHRLANAGFRDVSVISFNFRWDVPKNVPFYSAHFKLELIEAIATGQFGDQVGLIDIDTVFINPLRDWGDALNGSLKVYDISDQIFPHFGFDLVRHDLERVSACSLDNPRWYGGEFFVGDKAGFGRLNELIAPCWERYKRDVGAFHHTGDEMIMSAALNLAVQKGLRVVDVGPLREVARWWSWRTGFRQRSFDEVKISSILHLPADKEFLATQARHSYDPASFLVSYERYARPRLFVRRVFEALSFSREKPRKYVGALRCAQGKS